MKWHTLLLTLALSASGVASAQEAQHYRYTKPNRDGIGKIYMGRQISHVMGHLGAGWLERSDRVKQERTDLLIERLPLEPGFNVADIGAGTGYFSFPVAQRVPEGRVYAVDIQPEMLTYIQERQEASGIANVVPTLGKIDDPNLPDNGIDLAFIVDAYHEFSHPREMGEALFKALKPGGMLVLIEYRAEDRRVPIKRLHKMSEAQAKKEMAALGLEWVKTEDYLPQQHVILFRKPVGRTD